MEELVKPVVQPEFLSEWLKKIPVVDRITRSPKIFLCS